MRNFGDSHSLVRHTVAQQQQLLAQQQLAQQQLLVQQQQLAQQELQHLHAEQDAMEKTCNAMTSQFITISNSQNITINAPSHNAPTKPSVGGPLKNINYAIQNNMPNNSPLGTCAVSWNATGAVYDGNIAPGRGMQGYTVYADSTTVTMLFTDGNNPGWTYKAMFTYADTGNPSVAFQPTAVTIGYLPIQLNIQIPAIGVNLNVNPGDNGGNYIQLSGTTIPDGTPWYITFNPLPIPPFTVQFLIANSTPYDLTFDGTLMNANTPTPIVSSTIPNIQYDLNSQISKNLSFNWAGTTNNILTGGVVVFNACPPPGEPSFSINMGTEISILNYKDITVTAECYDLKSNAEILSPTVITVGTGVQNLMDITNIRDFLKYNPGDILTILLTFNAIPQLPLVTNFVFTNTTPYAITITPGDCVPSSSSVNPIPSGGTGTWTETIQSNDNYINPLIPHKISWTNNPSSLTAYSGTCITTLNTSDSGQGIVCSLLNVLTSGITTALTYNKNPIVEDQYLSLAVSQLSMTLPPSSVPNNYAISLTAGSLTNCVYSLNVTNSSKLAIAGYYTGPIKVPTPALTPLLPSQNITVLNGTQLLINLVWSGFPGAPTWGWGGPSQIEVTCNSDGTGTINIIDRGTFSPDYYPTMVATPDSNPAFTQSGSGTPPTTFPNPLPITGGAITLAFKDPTINLNNPP